MEVSGDDIAEVVLKQFDALPVKRKPLVRGDGVREWVPLSGIVAQGRDSLTCLATATGMKCLPQNKVSQAQGIVLHDSHAEILAIRSFNRFLLEECHALALSQKQSSEYVRFRSNEERTDSHFQPFALNDGFNLHMYCSEAPCGDASMELTMAAQSDSTPWAVPAPITSNPSSQESPSSSPNTDTPTLHGRGYFSSLGTVRRKPSRPDAPPTLSKSCSDKLSLKQSTSLLSSLISLLISPQNIYLSTLTLPSSQYSATACDRAFAPSGRLSPIDGKDWKNGYSFRPFRILTTEKEFAYSRRHVLGHREKIVPSNISVAWTPNACENLVGGVLQGRRQFDVRGASRVCKRKMWRLAIEVTGLVAARGVGVGRVERCLLRKKHGDVKDCEALEGRRRVKRDVREVALKGWVRNEGGEEFEVSGVEM